MRTPTLVGLALLLAGLLAGCAGDDCNKPRPYQTSRALPPLSVPGDLSAPEESGVLSGGGTSPADAPASGRCLDHPPRIIQETETAEEDR